MKFTLLVVGKTINKHLIELMEEYRNRLTHYIPFEVCTIPDLKNTKHLSFKDQQEKEGELILKQIDANDDVVLLDEKGKQYTSMNFSKYIEQKTFSSVKRVVFVIGGPYGFSENVYKRANGLISLSSMTFSHQMVRVFFLEQLYRAMTILKGEPYHHE